MLGCACFLVYKAVKINNIPKSYKFKKIVKNIKKKEIKFFKASNSSEISRC